MGVFVDLTGKRFTRLTVISRAVGDSKYTFWLCKCDCGNEITTRGQSLKSGNTKSCGCYLTAVLTGTAHNRIDLCGKIFGRLRVISYSHTTKRGAAYWLCLCECGNIKITPSANLKSGNTRSCGCLNSEVAANRQRKHGMANKIPEYGVWKAMIRRCTNPNVKEYFRYGMRGIFVCDEWLHSFEKFYIDMGSRPTSKHTLERVDNNKGYSKDNCIWLLGNLQSRNRRSNHWLEYEGRKMLLIDWAKELGVSHSAICKRLKKQESFESIVKIYQKIG